MCIKTSSSPKILPHNSSTSRNIKAKSALAADSCRCRERSNVIKFIITLRSFRDIVNYEAVLRKGFYITI